MKTQIARAGRIETATLTQNPRTFQWYGLAFDGAQSVADTPEEARDLLSDGSLRRA